MVSLVSVELLIDYIIEVFKVVASVAIAQMLSDVELNEDFVESAVVVVVVFVVVESLHLAVEHFD